MCLPRKLLRIQAFWIAWRRSARVCIMLESSVDNMVVVELVESAPVYRMLTQMDMVRF